MKNLRIIIIILIFLVLAGFIGSAVRSYYLFLKEPISPVVNALPLNTAVIIKTSSASRLFASINKSALLDLFDTRQGTFFEINRWMDSINDGDEMLKKLIDDHEILFALVPGDNQEPNLLVVTSLGKTSLKNIQKHIRHLLSDGSYSFTTEDKSIHRISHEKQQLWYYVSHGLIAISADKHTLQSSFNTLTSDSTLSNDKTFLRISATGGKRVDAVILINNHNLTNAVWPMKSNWLFEGTPFDQWTTFDLNIKKDEVRLGGFTYTNSNHLFKGQQPVDFDQLSSYPSNTAFAITISLSNQELYTRHFLSADTLHVNGYDASIREESDEIFTPADHLRAWIGNSVSLLVINDYFKGIDSAKMVLIKNKNIDSAMYYLKPFIQPVNDSIGILHYNTFTDDLWGEFFHMSPPLYCLITKKNVAISPNIRLLKNYGKQITSGTANNPDAKFTLSDERVGKNSNVFIYLRPEVIANWFMKSTPGNSSREWVNLLSKNNQIGLQYSADNDMQYIHAWLVPGKNSRNLPPQLTKQERNAVEKTDSKIDETEPGKAKLNGTKPSETTKNRTKTGKTKPGEVTSKAEVITDIRVTQAGSLPPQVVSGSSKTKKRIAVFSKNNTLKMYDYKGKLLWSFNLKEPSISQINEVDYRRNGKIHYVIASKNHMHIIDPDGKEVKGSPVKLPSPLSGELAVFDYDKRKDYRLLYVGTNHLLYNITLKGVQLPDWQKPKVKGQGKIDFFRSNGNDYLVYSSPDEGIRIFDRRGRERIKIGHSITPSANGSVFENRTNSKGIFMTINKKGELVYINNSGLISTSTFGHFGNNPWFEYSDFDADGSMDFIFCGSNRLTVYNRTKEVIISKTTGKGNFGKPFVYTSSAKDKWIVVRNAGTGEVIGFNNQGKSLSGKSIKSDTDPIVFNPGGSLKETIVTTHKGKLILTPLN